MPTGALDRGLDALSIFAHGDAEHLILLRAIEPFSEGIVAETIHPGRGATAMIRGTWRRVFLAPCGCVKGIAEKLLDVCHRKSTGGRPFLTHARHWVADAHVRVSPNERLADVGIRAPMLKRGDRVRRKCRHVIVSAGFSMPVLKRSVPVQMPGRYGRNTSTRRQVYLPCLRFFTKSEVVESVPVFWNRRLQA